VRVHGRYAQLAPKIDAERFHRVVLPEYLAAAHLDTGYSARNDNYGALHLIFARGEEIALVPWLMVQGLFIFMREASPFIWPAWLPPVRNSLVRAIEEEIEPWLRSLAIGRYIGGVHLRCFGTNATAHRLVERARECGFLGAAPNETVLLAMAPYVYAERLAGARRIGIADRNGASGAALLARIADVRADLGEPQRNELACRWFGLELFGDVPVSGEYDVVIARERDRLQAPVRLVIGAEPARGERRVPVAQPVPLAVAVSFDPGDSVEAGRIAVAAPDVALRPGGLRAVPIVGGSKGRIALIVRDDHLAIDDADTDAARALRQRLREQSFAPEIVTASRVVPSAYDLLHVIGYRCAAQLRGALARAGGVSVPIVVSPYLDDPKAEAIWGTLVRREVLVNAFDEASRACYAEAIAQRRLDAPGVAPIGTSASQDADVRALVTMARGAVVCSPDEEQRLRREFGFAGAVRCVPALLGGEPEPCAQIGALAGLQEFVLAHAPVDTRCNQYLLARACASLDYPLVLVGPVGDVEYHGEVLAALGAQGMWIPAEALSEADLAGLYHRARVFADVSWSANGLYRLARAGAAGAALVAPASGYANALWPGLAEIVDPASEESLVAGLRAAWEHAPQSAPAILAATAERCDPFSSLVAILAVYQAAAQAQPVG
jgi:hypothetical protein